MTEFLQTIPTMETTEQIQRIPTQFVGTNVGSVQKNNIQKKKGGIVALCGGCPRIPLLLLSRAEDPKWLIGSQLAPSLKYTHTQPPTPAIKALQDFFMISKANALPAIFLNAGA